MSISILFNCQAVKFRQLSFNVQIPGTEVLRFIIIVLKNTMNKINQRMFSDEYK